MRDPHPSSHHPHQQQQLQPLHRHRHYVPRQERQSRRVRLPSPPGHVPCSSTTGTSSLSQPISLDFPPPKENWPIRGPNDAAAAVVDTAPPRQHHYPNHPPPLPRKPRHLGHFQDGRPIDLDALIGGGNSSADDLDNLSRDRIVYSSSDEMTTSDSEICRYGGRMRASTAGHREMLMRRRFGKFPSLSTIYPDNSFCVPLPDHFELKAEKTGKKSLGHHQTKYLLPEESRMGGGRRRDGGGGDGAETNGLTMKMDSRGSGRGMMVKSQSAPKTPQRSIPALQMVEEISPVLPRPNPNEDFDVPPLPQPLHLSREWRPLQTSTLTNFHSIMPNTRVNGGQKWQQQMNGHANTGNIMLDMPSSPAHLGLPPRSLFDPNFTQHQCPSTGGAPVSIRPEQFNLPSALANSFDIKGILFLQVAISGSSLLLVHVRNAALFLKHPPASCFVKVEIRRSLSNRKRTKYDHRFRSKQTIEVRQSNWPEFFDDFEFKISQVHLKYGDKLGLALYANQSAQSPAAELLGRMSFCLRKFFRLAKQQQWGTAGGANDGGGGGGGGMNGQQQPVQVCDGGFFLLPDRIGLQTHLKQDNVIHRKYYDEIGTGGTGGIGGTCSSTMSSTSSFGSSPFKMMSEPDWPPSAHPSMGGGRAQFLSGPNVAASIGTTQKGGQSTNNNNNHHALLTTTTATSKTMGGGGGGQCRLLNSSQSSSSQSGVDCKRRAVNVNAIGGPLSGNAIDTTTSDFTSSALTFSSTGCHQMAPPFLGITTTSTTTDSFSSTGAEVLRPDGIVELGGGLTMMTAKGQQNGRGGQGQCQAQMQTHQQQQQQMDLAAPMGSNGANANRAKSQPPEAPQSPTKVLLLLGGNSNNDNNAKGGQQPSCSSNQNQQHHRLNATTTTSELASNAVRRVASFTHSPTLLMNPQLYKKRNSVTVGGAATDKMPRKNLANRGAFGKTLHFLKSKLDFSLSASVLCPSKEDCRLWQESFEALLTHKYGCLLFREFCQSEFSEENLEFWLECESFKRMKEEKKKTLLKAQQIYNTYIEEFAPKQVNLDAKTKMETKAALEQHPLRMDAFNLAQNRIEQLMASDSYPRFLKSEQYLELLTEREAAEKSGTGGTMANGLLRVASAKEGTTGTKKSGNKNNRSPSLSPILSNNSRFGRRNTCSPASPATLQIPSAIQE